MLSAPPSMGANFDRVETLFDIGAIAEKSAKDYDTDLADVSDILLLGPNRKVSEPGLLEESWYKKWLQRVFAEHSTISFDAIFPCVDPRMFSHSDRDLDVSDVMVAATILQPLFHETWPAPTRPNGPLSTDDRPELTIVQFLIFCDTRCVMHIDGMGLSLISAFCYIAQRLGLGLIMACGEGLIARRLGPSSPTSESATRFSAMLADLTYCAKFGAMWPHYIAYPRWSAHCRLRLWGSPVPDRHEF